MPSRRLLSPPPSQDPVNHLPPHMAGAVTAAFSFLLLLLVCFRRIGKKRTAPAAASDSGSKKTPHRLPYSLLRRATSNFSPSLRLGRGGFGSVYRGDLRKDSVLTSPLVAVKAMDSGSLQGEREFQNEMIFSSKIDCKYIVSVLGFSSNPGKRRMVLIYQLMEKGSLQDCLFHKKSEELRNWDKRFSIALDIAKGLEYLHHYCDPPIIHGDIKPSNILLDEGFNAKIGDFGLARFKAEDNVIAEVKVRDSGSVIEDTESVITTTSGIEEVNNVHHLDTSPRNVVVRIEDSPEGPIVSPRTLAKMASPSDRFDKTGISEKNNTPEVESSTVKDYVMEWIGNEVKEKPRSQFIEGASSSATKPDKTNKKKKRKTYWWASLDDEKNAKKKEKRKPREWWKEEYCEELERKKKKKKKLGQGSMSDQEWWSRDDEMYNERKKKRSWSWRRSRGGSKSSIDSWLDGISGELWKAKNNNINSHDSFNSGEIPKSGGVSSTTSTRGTICYIAPEYGNGGSDVSEKCDIYSFGVLLLVLIAGRRPLEVTGSPMSEFKRANLLSWARHLARVGKLLDLVDQRMIGGGGFLNEEQALMCITVALLCLQRFPCQRPTMKEVVGMLSGDVAAPQLPAEFLASGKGRFPVMAQKRLVL